MLLFTGAFKAQISMRLTSDPDDPNATKAKHFFELYKVLKKTSIYVVQTENKEINAKMDSVAKITFPNYVSSLTVAEALHKTYSETNLFIVIDYKNAERYVWDPNLGKNYYEMGIYWGKRDAKEFKDIYTDWILDFYYSPVVKKLDEIPASERPNYTDKELHKKNILEPVILTMIPSAFSGFKQTLDALEKITETKKDNIKREVAKIIRANGNAVILKNKTLLVLNSAEIEPFYSQYAFKKEKREAFDLSKLKSKNKKYCYMIYEIHGKKTMGMISIIDCETGKIIYQDAIVQADTFDLMMEKCAGTLNNSVNGIEVE